MAVQQGYLAIVLHAHLPYVRHPEYEYSLEENWLFEAITETYVPLFLVLTTRHRPVFRAGSKAAQVCTLLSRPQGVGQGAGTGPGE
jgi:hypothetical protein